MARGKAAFITGLAVTAVLVVSLWIPTIDNLFNIAPSLTGNDRSSLSQLPDFKPDLKTVADIQKKFVKYFIDNFGFRNALIRWNSLLRLNFLKVERFPKVLVGKDDWLYLIKDDDGNNVLDYYRVTRPFTSEREIAEWVQPLLELKKQCDRRGIRLLVVFAAMKTRIYPEYMPRSLAPLRSVTRLDQLRAYLEKRTSLDFIDLGPAMLEGKKKHRVYFKHDVHWNTYGAFYGYRVIAGDLGRFMPRLKPLALEDYSVQPIECPGGDLAGMLGLKDRFREDYYQFTLKAGTRVKRLPILYSAKTSRFSEAYEAQDRSLPRAVVFHDSFFNFVKPFIAEHFSRLACFQGYNRVDFSIVDIEKPDVLIYEMVESFIQKSPSYVTPMNY
jgi:alginate O-acetyltransferase complex protein AlgJ